MTVNIASEMHSNASRSLTQPLLDCMLYLTQYLYDPGNLPSSANKCILGNVYLRSNLSRNIATALSLSIDTYMQHSVGYISTVLLITVDTFTGADQLLQKQLTADQPKKQSLLHTNRLL